MTQILIVDDREENLYLLRALLKGCGYAVVEARHGAEALTRARQQPPDLIISDLLMPVMDGYTLLRHWKADERLQTIPFVVYTATYTEPKDERLALDLGADAFIIKPTEPDAFLARLQEVFAKKACGDFAPARTPVGAEEAQLKQYSESLIRRLEVKMLQLEQANRELARELAERQRLERERAEMEAQLRQQQKLEAIGTLAAGIAHEINNPINGVMNYAQLIMDESPAEAPTVGYAREIIHETERVTTIVRNLLRFARQEKQGHSPALVQDIVEQTLSLVRTVIKHDQITLHVSVPGDLPSINCRSQQIQQVLMNLLTNARDALNAKYPKYDRNKQIMVSAQLIAESPISDCGLRIAESGAAQSAIPNPQSAIKSSAIRITVEDRGSGIMAEVSERIFDPFFTTKPRDKGTGLGLSISHSIMKEHHGRLWFETAPGQWTKFHIDLPVAPQGSPVENAG